MPIRNLNLSKAANTLFLILIVVLYQSLFSGLLTIHRISLDLPLLILVYVGLTRGPASGAIFGFLVGFLLDLYNPSFLGLGAFIKTCLGYLVGSFTDNLYLESNISKGVVIFLSLLLNDFAYYLFSSGFDLNYTFFVFLNYSLLSGLYTAFAGLAFLWFLQIRKAKEITT
ncbi:MAG: rod shape-determining protein MreD [candidate division Zixibacteria bacterium RBG_16_43_9]|nr:MAG: rod shape-determining protein MreD [candidate division Zixibacteria bacterium RBG_16_43_9]